MITLFPTKPNRADTFVSARLSVIMKELMNKTD